jgi:hypothetical protein
MSGPIVSQAYVKIASPVPSDKALYPSHVVPGTVVDVLFSQSRFVVKTGDGSLMVRTYDSVAPEKILPGVVLDSFDAEAGLAEIPGALSRFRGGRRKGDIDRHIC